MSRIVVLTTTYLDKPYANGVCARHLIRALRQLGNEVNVICYSDEIIPKEDVGYVYPIKKPNITVLQSKNILNKAFGFVGKLFNPEIDAHIADDYYARLCECGKKGKIDAVIAMFFPIESIAAIERYKVRHKEVRAYIYELDSVGDGIENSLVQTLSNTGFKRWLKGVYNIVDATFVMKSHKEYWKKVYGKKYLSKLRIVDLPLLEDECHNTQKETARFNLIYSGRLDSKFRSPEYLLEVLKILSESVEYECSFFSAGDCESIIEEHAKNNPSVFQCGYIRSEELDLKLQAADCLVNIGNKVSRNVPSKLISYISYGKPIIHISSQSKDVCVEYLEKYPLALILSERTSKEEAAERINAFLVKTKGKRLSFCDLIQTFPMNDSLYSANLIMETIGSDVSKNMCNGRNSIE